MRKRNVHKNNVARRFAGAKAQSAMEYLMTYGWAILIIAVVLGALFQLGVFNANNFAPKAPPGACQVFRPNGPYTTSFINLEGICNGELPQYGAYLVNGAGMINVSLSSAPMTPQLTISAWEYQPYINGEADIVRMCCEGYYGDCGYSWGLVYVPVANSITTGSLNIEDGWMFGSDHWWSSAIPSYPIYRWNFFAATYNRQSGTVDAYLNGQLANSIIVTVGGNTPSTGNLFSIGWNCAGGPAGGYIANVQIYNTSLSANEIQALYQEGIGGAPIDLQYLVGWWPLNGNANDYSGNNNNGFDVENINFVSNWWSGYTPP